jgi:hypothetical protein
MGVVGGEAALGARFQKSCKVSAGVFSTAHRPKAHDALRMLGYFPSRDCFVGFEGFVFSA